MRFSWAGFFPAVINCGGDDIEILDFTLQYNIHDTDFDFFITYPKAGISILKIYFKIEYYFYLHV